LLVEALVPVWLNTVRPVSSIEFTAELMLTEGTNQEEFITKSRPALETDIINFFNQN